MRMAAEGEHHDDTAAVNKHVVPALIKVCRTRKPSASCTEKHPRCLLIPGAESSCPESLLLLSSSVLASTSV